MWFSSRWVLITLLGLCYLATWGVVRRRRELAGTTLVAPWCWGVLALAMIALVEMLLQGGGFAAETWSGHLRFAAAAVSFCPIMAILGAKRPQDRAWQLIVAALWLVLVWPAGEALAYRPEKPLEVHPARAWFMEILLLVGLFNGLLTRHWPSAVVVSAGQHALLAGQLPALLASRVIGVIPSADARASVGLAACCAGLIAWGLRLPRSRRASTGLDRLWLDFRDGFGAIWGLRLMERFNAAATLHDWPWRLNWGGVKVLTDREASSDEARASHRMLRGLLRRFVSIGWIAQRLVDP